MKLNKESKRALFDKTDGRCHLCHKKLVFKNYGTVGANGAWEREHSKARANGGTDHPNNLYPACIPCNRSKRDSSTVSVRTRNGVKGAPRSRKQRERSQRQTAMGVTASGALIGLRIAGPVGGVIGGVLGFAIGSALED